MPAALWLRPAYPSYLTVCLSWLQANAVMKAHNEKMAKLLLDEDPAARHKPVHMGSTLPQNTATTSALMDELKAETQEALEN